jgi:hypothetical protein
VAVVRVWQALDASGSDAWREIASEFRWRESDALELRVPVMGSQPEVTLATVTPPLPLTLTLTPTSTLTR